MKKEAADRPEEIDSVWTGANLATMTANGRPYGLIENGALAVSGRSLAWVGPAEELPPDFLQRADRVHRLDSGWITPGLVDCHTHLVYGGNRAKEFEQRLQGVSYTDILASGGGILSTVRATRKASEDDLVRTGRQRLESLLAEGLTTVEIKSGYGLDLETELKMLKAADRIARSLPVTVCPTFLGAHALPPEYKDQSDAYIDFVCCEVLPEAARKGLARAADVFCESIAFSPEQSRRVFQKATELGLRVKIHAEQLSNQEGAALASEFGALSADHLEHLTDRGVEAMARAGMVAVLLPGAFYCLGETRLPPIDKLRARKVPLAVSTDSNPGTSPVQSLLLMLNMACTLFRLTPEEALAGVTREGARALGLQDKIGTLEPGKDADFVLFDIDEPAELASALGHNPCRKVVRKGCVVR
ncbi:MAG: imidazolonepropionase [Desulfohalobiaceae bacterium]|nr:imidazolonepropionase [Desulfohalobiaceae bacterium]